MRAQATAAAVWLHGWIGLLLGWLLFFLALTGAFSVLAEKLLHPWVLPQVESQLDPEQANRLLASIMAEQPVGARELTIRPPGEMHDALFSAIYSLSPEARKPGVDAVEVLVRADDYRVMDVREGQQHDLFTQRIAGAGMLVQQMHTRFLLPEAIAQPLSGLLAPSMMLLAFTGLLLQPRVLSELFQNPLHKRELVSWRKFHKLLGAWVFPFLLFMGFSATFFSTALIYLVEPASLVKFEGDRAGILRELLASPEGHTERTEGALPKLGEAVAELQAQDPGIALTRFTIEDPDAPRAVIAVRASVPGEFCGYGYAFDAYDASLLEEGCGIRVDAPLLSAIVNALIPLHGAHVGGVIVAVFWFVFGLASAGLIWFGIAYWCGKRSAQPAAGGSTRLYRVLGRVNDGVCAGLLLIIFALFNLDVLLTGLGVQDYYTALHWVLPFALGACVLACAHPRTAPRLPVKALLRLAAGLAILAPLLHAALLRRFTLEVILADLVFLLLASGLLLVSQASYSPRRISRGPVPDA